MNKELIDFTKKHKSLAAKVALYIFKELDNAKNDKATLHILTSAFLAFGLQIQRINSKEKKLGLRVQKINSRKND
jgi:hypothetical protein